MYKNKFKIILLILIMLITISSTSHTESENINSHKKVYMIVADKLTLEDIDSMRNLKALASDGGVGIMNTRGANRANSAEGYLSINASSRAYGTLSHATAFNLKDKKFSLYKKRVGDIKKDEYQVGNTEINRILDINLDRSYDAKIGALGDNIHSAGLKTAIFGNSDNDENFLRMASLIPMDSRGLIDYGDVDDIVLEDENYPYGIKTDYGKISKEIEKIKDHASLIIIDTGDLKRLDLYNSFLNDDTFKKHRKNILREMDKFIGEINKSADEDSMFIVLSPTIENQRLKISGLAPIVIWEHGKTSSGILRSSTTRRDAIITNLDIAPTIANFLDIPKDDFIGNNIELEDKEDNLLYVSKLDSKTNLTSILRSPYLKLYNILIILVIIISSLYLIFNKFYKKGIIKLIETFLVITLSIPLVLLVIPILGIENIYLYIFASIVSLVILVVLIKLLLSRKNRLWALLMMNFIIIILDISTGSNLTKSSIMGYDPIIGARYFGIGNELLGVLLASMTLVLAYLLNKYNNKLLLIILPITVLLVGHPNLGANVGGTISVLFASIIFIFLISDIRINFKRLLLTGLGVAIVILVIGAIDIFINPNPTHLGKTILMIISNGPLSILSVLLRKLSVNIRLMKVSTWAKVLYTSLIFGVLLFKSYRSKIKSIYSRYKYLDIGFLSLISGSIIGLLLNDSGLLLAAISSMIMIITLIYLLMISLEEQAEEGNYLEVEDRE